MSMRRRVRARDRLQSAGTSESCRRRDFYCLERNARIQVDILYELVTGQTVPSVANRDGSELVPDSYLAGHDVEVLPLRRGSAQLPAARTDRRFSCRDTILVDAGVEEGDVSDVVRPMIAKLIAYGAIRRTLRRRSPRRCARTEVGVSGTNLPFLRCRRTSSCARAARRRRVLTDTLPSPITRPRPQTRRTGAWRLTSPHRRRARCRASMLGRTPRAGGRHPDLTRRCRGP